MKRKNLVIVIAILVGIFLGACKAQENIPTQIIGQPSSKFQPTVTQTLTATYTYQPSETSTVVPTLTYTPLPTNTLTPTSSPSLPTPTKTPISQLSHADVVFPLTWDGPYSVGNPIQYAPCYHYDPNTFDKSILTEQNWFNYFHAGDMYNLNSSKPAKSYIVLSPGSGKIVNISNSSDNGVMIVIETNYLFKKRVVYISLAHLTSPFRGDSSFPKIDVGSNVISGQPIGHQETLYEWGISEQAIDFQIRLKADAEGYPLGLTWNPQDFLDPYPFIQDDLLPLIEKGYVVFGYNRNHCLLSGHFP